MTTTATSLSDALPSTIPKLLANGKNWAVFLLRFQDAIEAKGFWGHFDGTNSRLVATNPTPAESAIISQWDKDKQSAKSLLTQKIPNSTLMHVSKLTTMKARWDAIVA